MYAFFPSLLLFFAFRVTCRLKLENPSTAFECVSELILKQGLQLQLKDFDNHLDDISNDWLNKSLNQKIQSFIASS